MRAAFWTEHGGPEVIRIGTLPDPEPGPGEVLVQIAAAGVAPLDWKLRAGLLREHFTPPLPKIPGRDGAGTVLASATAGFAPGDRVVVMAPAALAAGTHAERIVVPADRAVPLPEPLTFAEGAALTNAGLSALIALRTAGVKAGDRVLVGSGAGSVGGLLVQLCAAMGAEVTAICRATNAEYVRSLGAGRAVAYDIGGLDGLPPQDVVFDLMGGAVHDACYPLLRKGGHLVWLTAAPITDRGADYGVRVSRAMIADAAEPVAEVLAMAAAGRLKAQVAGLLPLDMAAEAQRRLAAGEVTRGRLLLAP